MNRRLVASFVLVSVGAGACIVPDDAKPQVGAGAQVATRFVQRGMTLVDAPVLQPKLAVALPTHAAGTLGLDIDANMDLRNDTGDAWFPDGHAGRFTQIETVAAWQRQFGPAALRVGVHNYALPNGVEFRTGSPAASERGGTSEAFAIASFDVLEATPYVALHYDFDEVRGGYYRGGIREGIPLGGAWSLALDGSLGYASEAQAAWMYGTTGLAGLADLRGEAVVNWQYDVRTALRAGMHGSLIVDNGIDDWFAEIGIDSDPIWFTLGVAWSF
jgi:hypothetical protein